MKILYLSDPEADYGTEQLWNGLYRLLGDDNVIDFPYKYCWHSETERLQNVDVIAFMKDNPTAFPGGLYSEPYGWIVLSKSPEYHYDEIRKMVINGEFDLILMPPRSVSIYYFKRLLQDCNFNIPPAILCDFEDYHDIRFDITATFSPYLNVLTKSNYFLDNLGGFQHFKTGKEKIYSLPLSSPLIDHPAFRFDDSNKEIDICARLGLSRSLRKDVIESLQGIKGFKVITSLDHVPYRQYLQEIAQSKMSVSVGGHGLVGGSPLRTWEILSYNTLLLSETLTCYYEHPLEDGKTCIFFNPEKKDDVCEKALYWLSNGMENERRRIAKKGHEYLKKYHTCRARAATLLEIAKKEDFVYNQI